MVGGVDMGLQMRGAAAGMTTEEGAAGQTCRKTGSGRWPTSGPPTVWVVLRPGQTKLFNPSFINLLTMMFRTGKSIRLHVFKDPVVGKTSKLAQKI